jgi:hypothetical protein
VIYPFHRSGAFPPVDAIIIAWGHRMVKDYICLVIPHYHTPSQCDKVLLSGLGRLSGFTAPIMPQCDAVIAP